MVFSQYNLFCMLSLLVNGTEGDKDGSPLPALEGPFPSHELQWPMTVPYSGNDIIESEWTAIHYDTANATLN